MGVAERRARHKKALRRQILEAAREVFVREGYENVSMRKIAQRIEYSPTTIYLHFRDKSDLLNCLCEQVFARLVRVLKKTMAERGDPLERLGKCMRAYVEFGLNNSDDYRVTFLISEHTRPPEESPAAWTAYGLLRSTVEEAVRRGKFRPVDIDTATQTLWAAAHGITSLLIIHADFPWADRKRLIDTVIRTAIAGLSA